MTQNDQNEKQVAKTKFVKVSIASKIATNNIKPQAINGAKLTC